MIKEYGALMLVLLGLAPLFAYWIHHYVSRRKKL
jgi:hypothetical protein